MSTNADEAYALRADAEDELASFRAEFLFPPAPSGGDVVYLAGNSLGLQPRAVRRAVEAELDDWARLAVGAHLRGRHPWLPYHEFVRGGLARLVGALDREVVAMNSLTVNLHLLIVSFYRPTRDRYRILIEDSAFPSDAYAVASQAAFHGFDPADAVVRLRPRAGEAAIRTDDAEAYIDREGSTIALVMLGAVNYLSGQWFDMPRLTAAARRAGCAVGWDLAHAAGNVPLRLHDWGPDFAAWCSYKYLNAGPGAVAGAFVHERHLGPGGPPRFAGWWGNDPATRFGMPQNFTPVASADSWQLSNPPILALAPLRASVELFDRAGPGRLRAKSVRLTGFMESLLERHCGDAVRVLTPRDPDQRGAQLSIRVRGSGREIEERLAARGIVVDFREPDVIRAAPAPLYCTFHDVWRFVTALAELVGAGPRGAGTRP